MPVPASSLSVAVQGIADFLDSHFGEDVEISTDTPQRASERAKAADKHVLNLFTYRISPAGLYSAGQADEPFFLRIHALLTPFATNQTDTTIDTDLRLLGHGIRVLASEPVLPQVMPGSGPADPLDFRNGPHLDYQLQAVLQAPTMEELNHIWTTQGGDLAYRLSAVYEFALIPVEPLDHHTPPLPVTTAIADLAPGVPEEISGFAPYGAEARATPLAAFGTDTREPSPATVLPVVLFSTNGSLGNAARIAPGTPDIQLALSGLPGARIAVRVAWTRADESTETQPDQQFTVATPRIDASEALVTLSLSGPQAGDTALITTRATDEGGTVLPGSPLANTLSLTTEAP